MISTSSPIVSVAVFDKDLRLVFEGSKEARGNASGCCFELLASGSVCLADIDGFVADVGPGGFTGLRVGVVLVKTLAWSSGKPVAGVSSFDLVAPDRVVSLPARRGSWLVREPGRAPQTSGSFAGVGYGSGAPLATYPLAANAATLLSNLQWMSAFDLLPQYLLDPSISVPKKAYLPGAVT